MVNVFYADKSKQFDEEELAKTILVRASNIECDDDMLEELCNIVDYYLDAVEWLEINMYRIAGIQLYDDGEIRLNLSPEYIEKDEKCNDELKTRLKKCTLMLKSRLKKCKITPAGGIDHV